MKRAIHGILVEGSYATGNLAAAVFESKDWVLIR